MRRSVPLTARMAPSVLRAATSRSPGVAAEHWTPRPRRTSLSPYPSCQACPAQSPCLRACRYRQAWRSPAPWACRQVCLLGSAIECTIIESSSFAFACRSLTHSISFFLRHVHSRGSARGLPVHGSVSCGIARRAAQAQLSGTRSWTGTTEDQWPFF